MLRGIVIDSLRPGWSTRPARRFGLLVALTRFAVLLFALHASGAAHLLADILLDDDMTCVDELARRPHNTLTPPVCPATQSIGHGQAVAPPARADLTIQPSMPTGALRSCVRVCALPSPPDQSIERPPRG